jgi:hypothetical protein
LVPHQSVIVKSQAKKVIPPPTKVRQVIRTLILHRLSDKKRISICTSHLKSSLHLNNQNRRLSH